MKKYFKILTAIVFTTTLFSACVDLLPAIEDLPSKDVAFDYSISDNTY